ncbi:hypothetical protein PBI_GAIA_111 [Mycobacterium phage Gaia]|uniref:Uncharacterized protein n=1 Tax=Mycobacterium phage Gaia TaxID=1486472 RepID=A0A068F8U2_9CAUD|nr:hypothetical protein VC46_gp122 [Mycobacterium phage Gaia]AID58930.1 hypothetical protein PBI_GAIA_111 [Mycobacterium phage Gaia]AYR00048.1 hypothetical protein PBI_NEBKISS_112 [Mycobacterium phage Nebkiss]
MTGSSEVMGKFDDIQRNYLSAYIRVIGMVGGDVGKDIAHHIANIEWFLLHGGMFNPPDWLIDQVRDSLRDE